MKQIAVVEDNPDNRLLVRVILEPLYGVTEYDDGFAALAGLQTSRPDLVLLDVSLPQMDGAEVLRRIRGDAVLRELPVIALTAHAMSGDREKFLADGFDDYVAKPIVDERILLAAIERLLLRTKRDRNDMSQNPDLDSAALERLRRLGGPEFVEKMVDLFLEYTGSKIAEARAAYVASNPDGIARAVHPVKSSAGNVGATRVQKLADELEILAKQGDVHLLEPALNAFEHAFEAVKPELEKRKNS